MNQTAQQQPANRVDYQEAKRIARDGDATARSALASRADTRPEILYFLAADPDVEVRRCIAENAETPRQADLLLARDDCEEVRCVLASKISRLFPEFSATERNVMRRAVLDILEVLAADQTKHVRELVSDALKDAPDVPAQVVRQLANDPHLTVCGPILEFSPVLTEEDLLEIISSKPVQGALGAISRRAFGLAESVTDAIVSSSDSDAIADLLANPSAQIREETLDSLIDSAPGLDAWHIPLVKRPALPANAARRIAGFVARNLLNTLRERTDLDKDVLDAVAQAVAARLEEEAEQDQENKSEAAEAKPRKRGHQLRFSERLSEKTIGDAALAGDRQFVVNALVRCSGEAEEVVDRIFELRSSKGIVAICWKAAFSMELAVRLQILLGRIAPDEVLKPTDSGDYPLTEEELVWQIEFFKSNG